MDIQRFLDFARKIMSLPTAPYHEHFVMQAVRDFAARRKRIELICDSYGNLLLLYDGRPRQDGPGGYLVATAHLDHPGLAWKEQLSEDEFAFEMLGGTDPRQAERAGVRIYSLDRPHTQRGIKGEVVGILGENETRPAGYRIHVTSPGSAARIGPASFAMWNLRTWTVRARRIHCRACDDLGGVAVGLCLLDELARRKVRTRAGLLLTRAEEVGFAGMLGAVRSGILDSSAFYINIECSSIRAGATLGGGPVVRVGDRMWTFDPHITGGLVQVANRLTDIEPDFRYQRKLMDSGSCEATVLMGAGYRTGAVALPLDNYHNTGANQLAPEVIHLDDVTGLVDLLVHLARHPGGVFQAMEEARSGLDKRLADRFKHQGPRLQHSLPTGG